MSITDFTLPNIALPKSKGGNAVLLSDWRVTIDGATFDLRAGTTTDGASIPRFLWRVCGHPLEAPRVYAALLHDALYGGQFRDLVPTRAAADEIYRDLLIALDVSSFRAYTEYYALRLFGSSHWVEDAT